MLNSFLLLTALLFLGPSPVQQVAAPVVPSIPAEAVQMKNPGTTTPESIAHTKQVYGYDCAVCHGDKGNGRGDVAVQMKLSLKNWTDPAALQNKTDGELFYIITHGQGQMPPEGDRAKPEEVWNMVVMVRSFSKP